MCSTARLADLSVGFILNAARIAAEKAQRHLLGHTPSLTTPLVRLAPADTRSNAMFAPPREQKVLPPAPMSASIAHSASSSDIGPLVARARWCALTPVGSITVRHPWPGARCARMPGRPLVAAVGRGARSVIQGMPATGGGNDDHLLMRRATGQLCENRSRVTGEVTSWGARFRYEGQRRYLTLEAESREEAVREMALLMFRVRRGIWEPPRKHRRHASGARPPKLADFAEDWLAGEKVQGGRRGTGLSPASYASLQWRLGHLLRFFASARLDEITVMDVDRYRQTKLGEGSPVRRFDQQDTADARSDLRVGHRVRAGRAKPYAWPP